MLAPAKEKVAIFICNDLTGLLILNRIVPGMKDIGYEPVIFHTGDHRNRQFKIPSPTVVAFFNAVLPRDVIVPTLESQPITTAQNHSARQLAKIHNVEYREIEDVNDPVFVQEIADDPSYRGAIAARFLQVFEEKAIAMFHEKGFLWNLHSGLLPNYQGLLTPYRAIANGETTYGMTLHDLTRKIDEGDIVLKGELPLDRSKPVLDLYLDTVPMGAQMILDSLAAYKTGGCIDYVPQDRCEQTYYTNPTAEEFRDFVSQGIFYADPQSTVKRLSDAFSASNTILRARLERNLEQAIDVASSQPRIPARVEATAQPAVL